MMKFIRAFLWPLPEDFSTFGIQRYTMRIVLFCIPFLILAACSSAPEKPAKKLTIDELYKRYPDSLPILIQHGNVLMERHDYDNALKDGAKAYRLDSNNIEARFLYASALNNRASRTVSEVMVAQDHFKVVVKQQPKNTKALVALASTYVFLDNYDLAFYYINEALRIDKRYRDAYIMKGTLYRKLGNAKLAKSSYQTAIDQDPDFFEAYIALGDLYLQDYDSICLEYYTTATQLRPNSTDALYSLAYGYQYLAGSDKLSPQRQMQLSEEALKIYRQMAKKDPEFTMSTFQQGWIKQFQQNDIDSAMIFYQSTLQKEPRFVEAWHNLGLCYEGRKEYPRALEAYGKALKYDPEFTLSREAAERIRYKK